METTQESSDQSHAKFWFVFLFFLLLMGLAHLAAELRGGLDARAAARGIPGHTVLYYRVVFTVWVSILLLTPALCFHLFSTAGGRNTYWRAFWTFAYLAFLTHLYWTLVATFHLNWAEIFHSQEGVATNPERVVQHPGPDLFLAAWWGLDVLLAWLVSDNKWVRVQRGAVHLLVFSMFFGAFTLASKASMVAHILGILMLLVVAGCFVLSVIVRKREHKSLMSAFRAGKTPD
jgi:hypothetical protein